jgi:hypothetical protein
MPAYPGALAAIDWLDLGDTGLVVVNSLLGALAVAAILLIARRAFADRRQLRLAVGLSAALYPTLVTYTGLALAENLSIAALCWLTYIAFFAPFETSRPERWLIGWFLVSSVVFATRAEGLLLVVVSLLVAVRFRPVSWRFATVMVFLAAIAPGAWAIRNDLSTGRFEFVDSLNRDATLVLSVDDGQFTSPLYRRGVTLATVGDATEQEREAYHDAVVAHVKTSLREETGRVLAYKAKSLLNFPFAPLVYQWSAERDYVLTDAVNNLNGRNVLRVCWAGILLLQYVLAVIGLLAWWRHDKRGYAIGIALYPVLALLLAIPFHSELRLWFGAAFLLLVPAVKGASVVAAWQRARQRPIVQPQ